MRREREVVLGAFGNQEVPFERVVEQVRPERSLSYSPLFQVAFDLQNTPASSLRLGDIVFSQVEAEWTTAKFDLTLSMEEAEQGLIGFWGYRTDLFDAATIARISEHFKTLLEGIVADPGRTLLDLPILSEAERRQLLVDWNSTQSDYSNQTCIHEMFEAQAERTPEAVAVVFEKERLSYRELNSRANKLGRYLKSLGVGPEVLVGVYVERSLEMIVGLLGILKAGGAYVPIDPGYPPERVSFMLSDIKAPVILTRQKFAGALPLSETRVVYLDSDREAIARHSEQNFVGGATADNLAYVIFTSGSTGRPKGVMVEHGGLCNLAEAQARAFGVQPDSRVLQFAAFSFDASVSEVFTALIKGATLWLASQERLMPGQELVDLFREGEISIATLPPTVLSALPEERFPSLRTVIAAGEACSADIVRRWAAGRKFLNAYGPTEATVCATMAEIVDGSARPTIGRPIANARVYVLDERQQPVPIGVAGEIHIGGAGVARGYLNRADLTAERFIPDPFGGEAGARLYRTGDLARYLPDGSIEFLGRKDHQVKVRGYRIELGEIEEALKRHPAVREVVALAREDVPGEKRLAAYVIPGGEDALTVADLRSFLGGQLPEYMVPQTFVMLDDLPLTPVGKVDRRALESLELSRPELGKDRVPPRTGLEELLARMWQEILGIEEVGVHDSFFELGGDSIRGAIFINRLQEKLGEVVYVVVLFDAPNIADLAAYLTRHYPDAVAKVCGVKSVDRDEAAGKVDAIKVAEVRELISASGAAEGPEQAMEARNPPAVFVLSPPRSGSTLMRVMLGGHPRLFAPPELELLGFKTLADRATELTGRYSFWLEGTIRAIMQLRGCGAEEARRVMRECEDAGMTTKQFYASMQESLGGRMLVDKTPSYSLDARVLKRAEDYFDNALYIHLLRHPSGMIRSFEDAKLEQVFFRHRHNYTSREIAEIIWVISQENILAFLEGIPRERQFRVRFEELVKEPEKVMKGISEFLGLEPHEDMLKPYAEKEQRMTNGIHPLSKMLGDIKFHEHKQIDADAAERWKESDGAEELGDLTWELAERLGYESQREKGATYALGGTRPTGRELTPIRRMPRGRDAKFPLSFAQQRLWFLDQLEPNSDLYNIPVAIRLTGNLRVEKLEESLDEIVRRHEVLRTSFAIVDGQPMQVIAPELKLTLPVIDLTGMAKEDREAEARRLAGEQARQPFDLRRAPLLRASVARLTENDHVIMVTMHHIVSDEWSMEVLVREVASLYEAFSRGEPSPLGDLPLQYADFALWQRGP
ncbi:MAG TPA: amino acid adenylation domain-containing protein, partial [Blastocatellia bacterium]|nr:amino acid adenylation domain-containing protein [Blastocatellia bacterium]